MPARTRLTDRGVVHADKQHACSRRAPWLVRYQFQPGVSGNPAGRPKRGTITEVLHAILAEPMDPSDPESPTKLEQLARVVVDQALSGDFRFTKILLDRIDPVPHSCMCSIRVEKDSHAAVRYDYIERFCATVSSDSRTDNHTTRGLTNGS